MDSRVLLAESFASAWPGKSVSVFKQDEMSPCWGEAVTRQVRHSTAKAAQVRMIANYLNGPQRTLEPLRIQISK